MKHTVLLLSLFFVSTGFAERFYVDASASPGGDGTSWGSAFNYLQDALDQTVAARGDEVWIASGIYYPDDGTNVTDGDRTASFYVLQNVTLYGGFAGSETDISQRNWDENESILSGEIYPEQEFWSLHVCQANDATFDGVCIINGNANGEYGSLGAGGGGIISLGGLITVKNSKIYDNHCVYGGAGVLGKVYAINSIFTGNISGDLGGAVSGGSVQNDFGIIEQCVFRNNSASMGGAIFRVDSVRNCVFEDNVATYEGGALSTVAIVVDSLFEGNSSHGAGGAISESYLSGGIRHISNSIFIENTSNDRGGAIEGEYDIINSCFVRNAAPSGGAVFQPTKIINSLFIENEANNGGAVFRPVELVHCTFFRNTATENGSALFAYSGEFKLFGNLFWENSEIEGGIIHGDVTNFYEPFPSPNTVRDHNLIQGGEASIVGTIDFGDISEYLIDSDPGFINPDDPDGPDDTWGTEDDGLRLAASSPCISMGIPTYLPEDEWDLDEDGLTSELIPFDFGNFNRIQDDLPDLGAYEFGDSKVVKFLLSVESATGGSSLPSEPDLYEENISVEVSAIPNPGYIFSNWSGGLTSSDNPLEVTMTSNVSITANFIRDTNDTDGDGLSNYDEFVTYGSNPGLPDTDFDGINDGDEVAGLLDPTVDNSATIQMFQNNPEYLPNLYDQEAYESNYQAGIDAVLNNPEDHNLYTPDQVAGVDFDGLAIGKNADGIFEIRFGLRVSDDFSTWIYQPVNEGEASVEGGEIKIQFNPVNPSSSFYKGELKAAN